MVKIKETNFTSEITSRIVIEKAAFNKTKILFSSKLDLNLRKKVVTCYICSKLFMVLKRGLLKKFEMWCWRRMEISWTDRVRNEEALHRVKEERNVLHTIKRRKANWIGHILRGNCLLKHVIEGKREGRREVTGGRGGRRKQLLHDLERKIRYCKLKEEAVDGPVWTAGFGRVYGLA
jgi:hypothetical protein